MEKFYASYRKSKMASISNQVVRLSPRCSIFFLKEKKELKLIGPHGTYNYPLLTTFRYFPKSKKLYLLPNKNILPSLQITSFVLLSLAQLGVCLGYRQQLNLVGIGYQVVVNEKQLTFKLGYSHQILIDVPSSILINCLKSRTILLKSSNLQKLRNFSALLRSLKLPNPYKEKGIYYLGERLRLKQGKKT